MKPEDFELFSTLVKQRAGMILARNKAYFLESRLMPVARKYNLKSLDDIAQEVRAKRHETLMADITEAIVPVDTSFFRDRKIFRIFAEKILPRALAEKAEKKTIRILSAGTASGQEAYSIAMMCRDNAELMRNYKVDIVGVDLNKPILNRAEEGIYTHFEVQRGLPIAMLVKYFNQLSRDKWQLKDEIRKMVQFSHLNLLRDYGPIGTFDIIFCRNIIDGFDETAQKRLLEALAQILVPKGALILGVEENAYVIKERVRCFEEQSGIYTLV